MWYFCFSLQQNEQSCFLRPLGCPTFVEWLLHWLDFSLLHFAKNVAQKSTSDAYFYTLRLTFSHAIQFAKQLFFARRRSSKAVRVLTSEAAAVAERSAAAAAGAKAVATAMQELYYFAQSTTVDATVNAQSMLNQRLSQRPKMF